MSLKNLSLKTLERSLPSDLLDELIDRHFGDVFIPQIQNIGKLLWGVQERYYHGPSDQFYYTLIEFVKEFPFLMEEIENITDFLLPILGDEEWTPWHDTWMENNLHEKRYIILGIDDPIIIFKRKSIFHTLVPERIDTYQIHSAIFAFFHLREIPVFNGVKFIRAEDWQ